MGGANDCVWMKGISRRFAALILTGIALALGGCVFLRLLEVKRQLAEFDRFFTVDARDGLKLTFANPVLLRRDVTFLGLHPESRRRAGAIEKWDLRWIKEPAPKDDPGEVFEQTGRLVFVRGKLATVEMPERFFAYFPKSVLIAGLRAMGRASVDRAGRTANSELEDADFPEPGRPLRGEDLLGMLGHPLEIEGDPAQPEWRYVFRPVTPAKARPVEMRFAVDRESGFVRRIRGRLPVGSFAISYR